MEEYSSGSIQKATTLFSTQITPITLLSTDVTTSSSGSPTSSPPGFLIEKEIAPMLPPMKPRQHKFLLIKYLGMIGILLRLIPNMMGTALTSQQFRLSLINKRAQ